MERVHFSVDPEMNRPVGNYCYSHLKNYYLQFTLNYNKKNFMKLKNNLIMLVPKALLNFPASSLANVAQDFYYEIGRRNKHAEDQIDGNTFSQDGRIAYYVIYGCLPLISYINRHFDI